MNFFPEENRKSKTYTPKEAKLKAADYCSYQERSQQEVRNKLYTYGLHKDDVEDILTDLVLEGFINEERFSTAYVGGKFRMKKWGRLKIIQGLKQHNISEYCIRKGLQEIDEDDYQETISALIEKKRATAKGENEYLIKDKIARYLIQKGFESQLVWENLNDT